MNQKSPYVCRRCGLGVVLWMGSSWKHLGGWKVSGCGLPPIVGPRLEPQRKSP